MTDTPRQIKILEKTYQLPALSGNRLSQLQQKIQARQVVIKTGQIEKVELIEKREETGGFFGFGKKTTLRKIQQKRKTPLSVEERLRELENQIQDYGNLMGFLQEYKATYQHFLIDLSAEIQEVIRRKCSQIQEVERIRHELEQEALADNDEINYQDARAQKRELLELLVVMDKAAVLMLRKIDLISLGIQKLTEGNEQQKELLDKVRQKLTRSQRNIQNRLRIKQIKEDISKLMDVALNFEEYMEEYLGPFQALVNEAAKVDQDLASAVEEIRGLAEDLLSSEGGFFSLQEADSISESILNFQVLSETNRYQIPVAIDDAQRLSIGAWSVEQLSDQQIEQLSINKSVEKIQTHMAQQLGQVAAVIEVTTVDTDPILSDGFYLEQDSLSEEEINLIYFYESGQDLSKYIMLVSETEQSQAERRFGSTDIFLEEDRRGSFCIMSLDETGSKLVLVPKPQVNINQYNLVMIADFFECLNFRQGNSNKFVLIKPAKVSAVSRDNQQLWKLDKRGVLQF